MRVILTLHGKTAEEQALMRQFAALAQRQTRRPVSRFPFHYLELILRAGLIGMEKLVRRLVLASERRVLAIGRLVFG